MASVLSGLTDPSAPNSAPDSTPTGAQGTQSASSGAQVASVPADPQSVVQQYPFLGDIASGKLPGVYIPKGWTNIGTKVITPQVMNSLGLVFSKANDPDVALAIVNPKKVPRAEFLKLDKENKLDTHFPSITQFVPSVPVSAQTGAAAAPVAAAAPQEPGPSAGKVDVVPMAAGPGAGANAQDAIAKARTSNLTENQVPSARQIPGGGTVLNGLLKRAV